MPQNGGVRPPSALESPPVLLALRALKLGDLLVAVPALRGLSRGFPEHRLVLAAPAWLDPIARLVPGLDALHPTPGLDAPLDLPRGSIDIAVNLHGNGAESREVIDALGARRKIVHRSPGDPDGVPWEDGILERERWARLVTAAGAPAHRDDVRIRVPDVKPLARDAVVLHVGAFYGSRQWPVARFARVARELRAEGRRILITGDDRDRPRALAVGEAAGLSEADVRAGRGDLSELAAVIAHAGLVISADTGAAHLASAYGTPSVVIFGPAPPEEWGPPPGPHRVLTDALRRRGEAFADAPDPALLAVTAESVLDAAHELMHGPASDPPSPRDDRGAWRGSS